MCIRDRYEEGIRILTEGTRLSADPMFYNIMGKDAEALKHFGQAEACFKQASYMAVSYTHLISIVYFLIHIITSLLFVKEQDAMESE